jgi:hypothetical protein
MPLSAGVLRCPTILLQSNTVLLPVVSLQVMKGETVPRGATWAGVPASPAVPNIKFTL